MFFKKSLTASILLFYLALVLIIIYFFIYLFKIQSIINFFFFLILVITVSIIVYWIKIYFKTKYTTLNALFIKIKDGFQINITTITLFKQNKFSRVILVNQIKNFYKNSSNHYDLVLLYFSVSFLVLVIDSSIESQLPTPVAIFLIIIFLYSLGLFFLQAFNNLLFNAFFYILKFFILIIFITSLMSVLLTSNNNIVALILIVFFSITYSLILIHNVLNSFHNIFFQIINIILLFMLMLLVTGFSFGMYYLINNNDFILFNDDDYYSLMTDSASEVNVADYFIIIEKGLIHFYTFPTEITLETPKKLVFLFEYIVGFFYNVVLIGFFISYGVTKFTNKKANKFN